MTQSSLYMTTAELIAELERRGLKAFGPNLGQATIEQMIEALRSRGVVITDHPQLGLASNRELIDEISTRIDNIEYSGLDYRPAETAFPFPLPRMLSVKMPVEGTFNTFALAPGDMVISRGGELVCGPAVSSVSLEADANAEYISRHGREEDRVVETRLGQREEDDIDNEEGA